MSEIELPPAPRRGGGILGRGGLTQREHLWFDAGVIVVVVVFASA
jgi:hypothetical protein